MNGRKVETDIYDGAGNRTSVTTTVGTMTATYDAENQLVRSARASYSSARDGNLARVTGVGGTTSYTFDDLGRLRRVSLPNGESVTYLVDAQGRRVGREVDGRLVAGYLYDAAGKVVAETDGAGAVVARYGYDHLGHLALVEESGKTYDVVTDQNGSPLLVVDAGSGKVADAITYNAWGQVTSQTAPGTVPFGFDGGLGDPLTGLVHFGARDYDPATGTWTGPDPIGFAGGDADLYRFAADDPVNNADPTGLAPQDQGPALGGSPTADWSSCTGLACLQAAYGCLVGTCGVGQNGYSCLGLECVANTAPSPQGPVDKSGCLFGACGVAPSGSYCTGFGCFLTSGNGCAVGACQNGPNGFSCTAAVCLGRDASGNTVWCVICSYGDTHLTAGGRLHYDFQAAGEFTAIQSPGGSIDVQVRQQPDVGESNVTFATALAANVGGDRVGVYAREPFFLLINGRAVNGAVVTDHLANGGIVARDGSNVTVTWPDGGQLAITLVEDFYGSNLSYNFTPAPGAASSLTGLLGTDNTSTQLVDRDGSGLALSDPKFETKLYSQFANSWRISQVESLFDYRPGESTATFTNPRIPYSDYTVASLPASARAHAEAVCAALGVHSEPLLDDCVLDVGVTGDPAFAAAEAQVAAAGAPTPASPSSALSFGDASNVSFPSHSGTVLKGASCPTGASCVAVGQDMGNYAGANGTIVFSETAGGWRAAPAPVPTPPPTHGADNLASVSCRAAGTCTAVGAYQSTNDATSPLVETGAGSAWGPATTVALPAAGATGGPWTACRVPRRGRAWPSVRTVTTPPPPMQWRS